MNVFRASMILSAGLLLISSTHAFAAMDSIAVDDEAGRKAGDVGFGVGEGPDAEAAKKEALKNCKSFGNTACEVAVTYDKCGAYAASKEHSGTGTGASEEEAKKTALSQCGEDKCKVVVSDCVGKS
jgi:hypothetical protein